MENQKVSDRHQTLNIEREKSIKIALILSIFITMVSIILFTLWLYSNNQYSQSDSFYLVNMLFKLILFFLFGFMFIAFIKSGISGSKSYIGAFFIFLSLISVSVIFLYRTQFSISSYLPGAFGTLIALDILIKIAFTLLLLSAAREDKKELEFGGSSNQISLSICTQCGHQTTYIQSYNRWYCNECKRYS